MVHPTQAGRAAYGPPPPSASVQKNIESAQTTLPCSWLMSTQPCVTSCARALIHLTPSPQNHAVPTCPSRDKNVPYASFVALFAPTTPPHSTHNQAPRQRPRTPPAAIVFFGDNFRSALFAWAKTRRCLQTNHTKPTPAGFGGAVRRSRAITKKHAYLCVFSRAAKIPK